jgi:hypothetical protein
MWTGKWVANYCLGLVVRKEIACILACTFHFLHSLISFETFRDYLSAQRYLAIL